jgi:antirestriction protein
MMNERQNTEREGQCEGQVERECGEPELRREDRIEEGGYARQRSQFSPRIYVASLSDYNTGRLHGNWIDADQEPHEIWAAITAMLAASGEPGAKEWAIHDYEDFGGLRLSEWDSIEHVSAIALGVAEYGAAFAHWATRCREDLPGEFLAELARFSEVFMGQFENAEAFGRSVVDDLELEAQLDTAVPSSLRSYVSIDYAMFGRDLLMDMWTVQDADGIWVYWA